MDPGGIVIVVGMLAALCVPLSYKAFFSPKAKLRKAMRATALVDIGEARPEMGAVRLVGRVKPVGASLRSPFSGRECVLFEVTAESRRNEQEREVVLREVDAVDFLLEDLTGSVLVRVSRSPNVLLAKELEWDTRSPSIQAFLARHGLPSKEGVFSQEPSRFRELVLEPGERTAVVGVVHREHDPETIGAGSGYRDGPSRLVAEATIVATDEN